MVLWNGNTANTCIEGAVAACDWNETMHFVDDAIGTCAWLSSFRGQFGGSPPYHIFNLPEFYLHGYRDGYGNPDKLVGNRAEEQEIF